MWGQRLLGASISGVVIVALGLLASWIVQQTSLKVELPKECATWNNYHVMELALFLTGVFSYFVSRWIPLA